MSVFSLLSKNQNVLMMKTAENTDMLCEAMRGLNVINFSLLTLTPAQDGEGLACDSNNSPNMKLEIIFIYKND